MIVKEATHGVDRIVTFVNGYAYAALGRRGRAARAGLRRM